MLKIESLHVFLIPLLVFLDCKVFPGDYLITENLLPDVWNFCTTCISICLSCFDLAWSLRKSGKIFEFHGLQLIKDRWNVLD